VVAMITHISLVLAMAANGVIGQNGALPWRIPEDMRRFKSLTMGKPCIMGRKTWDSLPKKPLPGRTNIVITRDRNFAADGAVVVNSLDDALSRAAAENPDEIMIIGGAEIYKAVLPRATRIHLTEVQGNFEGDAHMPPFDSAVWKEISRERHTLDAIAFSYVTLEKRT
jgi:dihydrofolate reductase